jgi:queuine tRNA-ribosyltransferase
VSEPLVLLDVGLGAGSNAAFALQAAYAGPAPRRALHVISFDVSLAAFDLALGSEPEAFGFVGESMRAAHDLRAHGVHQSERVHWTLQLGDLRRTLPLLPPHSADVVFWDPFSPRLSPELWSFHIFSALHRVCRGSATLHTYSAATATRSALLLAGFAVGKGPCVSEKQRRSTQAALRACDLGEPLDASWLRTLRTSTRALPGDAPHDAFDRLEAARQFAREVRAPDVGGGA